MFDVLSASGALEMGGEVNSAALLEFQGHISRFQVRKDPVVPYVYSIWALERLYPCQIT